MLAGLTERLNALEKQLDALNHLTDQFTDLSKVHALLKQDFERLKDAQGQWGQRWWALLIAAVTAILTASLTAYLTSAFAK